MICRSSAIATALLAAAFVVSLVARPAPRPDPIPELCTEKVEADLRRFEEALKQTMHLPPIAPNDIATRKLIKENLINACVNDALRRASAKP